VGITLGSARTVTKPATRLTEYEPWSGPRFFSLLAEAAAASSLPSMLASDFSISAHSPAVSDLTDRATFAPRLPLSVPPELEIPADQFCTTTGIATRKVCVS